MRGRVVSEDHVAYYPNVRFMGLHMQWTLESGSMPWIAYDERARMLKNKKATDFFYLMNSGREWSRYPGGWIKAAMEAWSSATGWLQREADGSSA